MNGKRPTKAEREAEARFVKLISQLNSDVPSQRQQAEQLLSEQSDAIGEELRVRLERMTRERRRLPLFWLSMAVFASIVVCAVHYLFLILWPSPHGHDSAPYSVGITNILIGMWLWKHRRNQMTRVLARFDDVRMAGILAEALRYGTRDTRLAARNALVRLLPRMQASDAALLNAAQRERLAQMLHGADTPFILVILKAYEQIGGAVELPAVTRLLQKPRLEFTVREAAEACLPYLHMRTQQTRGSDTLLRPAATAADSLLRPATQTDETDQTQLLRLSDI